MIFYRKYFKFFRDDYVPITKYEKQDKIKSLKRVEYLKFLGFTMFVLFNKYYLKAKKSLNKKVNDEVAYNILRGLFAGFSGYLFAYLVGLYTLYNHTDYVRLRMSYERDINFSRENLKDVQNIYDDYPFAGKVSYLYNDFEIKNNINKKNIVKDK